MRWPPRLRGLRIRVTEILHLRAAGTSPDEIRAGPAPTTIAPRAPP
jgi:hypothetical protein